MEKVDDKKLSRAVERLKALLPKVRTKARVESDERLFNRFRPIFSAENLSNLTEKDFRDFTIYKQNEHWTGIHRHNNKVLANMESLRKTLKLLVDESMPIDQRIDQFRPTGKGKIISGLGSSIYTAILFVLHPDKYPVLNTKTRRSLRTLGLYTVKSSDSHGTRYKKVIETSQMLAAALDCTLVELDGLHHHLLETSEKDELPALFKLSPGKQGEAWEEQHQRKVAAIAWGESGDLNNCASLAEAAKICSEKNEGGSTSYITQQYSLLRDEMQEDDLVLYYAKGKILGVGVVTGGYRFDANYEHAHTRSVRFVEPFIPVDITSDEELKNFFYDNNTLRSVDDEELSDSIIKIIRETNPQFNWEKDQKLSQTEELENSESTFSGYKKEAFSLLKKYELNPIKATYQATKSEFELYIKEPTRALMANAAPLVEQILGDEIETETRILSVMNKNDFGKGGIHSHYWAAFYPTAKKRISSPQLFVILNPNQIRFGFGFGLYSKEFEKRFNQRIKDTGIFSETYLSQLKALGIGIRIHKPAEKLDSYDGPFDESILIKALEAKDEQPNFDVCLSKEEVVALGPKVADKVNEVFSALFPLYILATCDNPDFFLKKWESKINPPGEDAEDEISPSDSRYNWQSFLSDLNWSESSPEAQNVQSVLGDLSLNGVYEGRQFIFYGPPGTGKTRAAMKLAAHLASSKKSHLKIVQFHQSYGYEQFIEGIRPKTLNGQLSYETREGVFVEFCRNAECRPNEQFVFLIDELNRGNISRIFGELMYLLEYREQKLPLLYSQTPFSIPKNVVIIGTMNSADRSIALVDYALRRRFNFIEIKPQSTVLNSVYRNAKSAEHIQAIRFLDQLNSKIRDPRLCIGHSYFLSEECRDVGLTKAFVRKVWDTALFPLLQEYFLAMPSRLDDFDFERIWSAASTDPSETSRAA